jgi:hypothetical protein
MRNGQKSFGDDQGRKGAGLILLVARALACSVEVFLHRSSTFGERYLGAQAALAALIIFIFPIFGSREDPTPLWYFMGAYIVMCAATRAATVKRRTRGELGPHSFYTGTPRLLGRSGEKTVKGVVEPVVVFVTAALVSGFSPLLGGYLATAGIGLLVSANLTLAVERKRMLDMHDAYMEQRRTAEEWRSMHRD